MSRELAELGDKQLNEMVCQCASGTAYMRARIIPQLQRAFAMGEAAALLRASGEPVAYRVIAKGGQFTRGIYERPTSEDFGIWQLDGDIAQPLYAHHAPDAPQENDALEPCMGCGFRDDPRCRTTCSFAKADAWDRAIAAPEQTKGGRKC